MKKIALIFLFSLLSTFVQASEKTITIIIQTDQGNIEAVLYPERAPITVQNFIKNMKSGLYEKGRFYRASRHDNNKTSTRQTLTLIQGGAAQEKEKNPIAHETTKTTGISHQDGVLSMARNAPGTATSEFFICIGDNSGLDYNSGRYGPDNIEGYATFGRVTSGMDVVLKIQGLPTGSLAKGDDDWFGHQLINDTVVIHNIILK